MPLLREELGPKKCLRTRSTIYLKRYHATTGRDAEIECQERAAQALQAEKLTKPREHKRVVWDGDAVPPFGLPAVAKYSPELREEFLLPSTLPGRQRSEVAGDRQRIRARHHDVCIGVRALLAITGPRAGWAKRGLEF